jgi:hypothetical protein
MMQTKPEDMKISPSADSRIPLDVIRIEPVGNGKVKVKVKQTQANLIDMCHQGKNYTVVKNLGRGRYIMRPAPTHNTEMIMTTK